jgi:Ca2+-binding EF-hand superfamily protein
MTKVCIIALSFGLFGWAVPSTVVAAKADGPKAQFFAKYDKNHNGVIDADEKEAIRKDYAAKPDGDLKRFDKNHDGKLDDEEIAAIKPPTGKGKNAATADLFAKYDKNHNGLLDADEKDAIRKDYAAKPDGELKKFDKNSDGKLDNQELDAIKPATVKKGGNKAGKAGKAADKADQAGGTAPVAKPDK